jgi:hypothetical protein
MQLTGEWATERGVGVAGSCGAGDARGGAASRITRAVAKSLFIASLSPYQGEQGPA